MSGSQQSQQQPSSSRSGRFPNSRMPPTSNQPPQAPGGFMSQNFHPNNSIWSLSNTRDRNIASRDSDELPSGSSALATNNDGNLWGSSFWNSERNSRPSSTSPNRTRDGGLTNGSGFPDIQHASSGPQRSGFGGNAFQEETNGYHTFIPQRRGEESSVLDQMSNFPTRDSLPPSRQSQGSPAYDLYHGHTPNNSLHSQRPMNGHTTSLQSANQRAFNINRQLEDDLASSFSRQATLNGGSNSRTTSFNPASQPFQMNSAPQPWAVNGTGSRLNSIDMNADPVAGPFAGFRRESVDRASPVSNYRLDQGNNSPRGYAPHTDSWMNRGATRDPRAMNTDKRAAAQQYTPYSTAFFPGYPGYQLHDQYSQQLIDASYLQNMRQPPILSPYGIPLTAIHPLNGVVRPRDKNPMKDVRSVLLDEFRQSKSKRYDLKDIYQHVVEFSGDQHGSRFIQQKLETANSDEKDQVFLEIEPNAIQLMKDVFGNYVIQKFFEHGSQVQKKILAEKMKGKVINLSLQVYACRVVQKALEHILDEQQAELTSELQPEIVRVIKDQNGNHVVQKTIELVSRRHLDFIMTALMKSVEEYAKHTYGCRIIQRMLEYGTEEDKAILMHDLHKIMASLLTDQYGNYVAQHVIENGNDEDRSAVIELAIPNLFMLSKHKFASNVVEKCIEYGSIDQRIRIRDRLMAMDSDGTDLLGVLMRDQYGNYVVQKLCEHLKGADRQVLVEQIKPHYYNIKKNGSSRQIQALDKYVNLNGTDSQTKSQDGVDSSIPTPTLTHEPNSPQSSGPPSTNASAVGAPINDEDGKHGGREVAPFFANETEQQHRS